VIFLDETFGVREIIGALIILAGFGLIIFQKYRENKANESQVIPKLLPTEAPADGDEGAVEETSVIELEEMSTDTASEYSATPDEQDLSKDSREYTTDAATPKDPSSTE